ncbi:MAG: 4'-phosphopantetheinyl transferase superfamily protein [Oscillospiraceae bacterium]|nr:4'-phosphopantetheinyl transferase superfamily protein [Oscillospiraceae bacterium]
MPFGRSDPRALRLCRLRGRRLAHSMTAELLCRDLLAELQPEGFPALEEDASGKPFLPRCALYVSLSHSGAFAAAAAADTQVGIDLQKLRTIKEGVLRRCFSPAERDWVTAGDGSERAVRLWTMKEAYGKMTGTGIFRDNLFCAGFDGDCLLARYDGVSFRFPEAPEGYLITVCLADPIHGA